MTYFAATVVYSIQIWSLKYLINNDLWIDRSAANVVYSIQIWSLKYLINNTICVNC